MGKALATQIAGLRQGDHVCCYYDNAADQSAVVVAYIDQGLKRSERCLYIADDRSAAEVAGFLGGAGIDVRKQLSRGALVLISSKEAHLKSGRFDCEAMLALLNDAVEQALNDGFKGLRAAGEMTWILSGAPGSNEALEYEALMNEFYPKSRALGLCLYNRSRFEPDILDDMLRTHPRVMIDQRLRKNPFFEPPRVFFKRCSVKERFDHRVSQLASESGTTRGRLSPTSTQSRRPKDR